MVDVDHIIGKMTKFKEGGGYRAKGQQQYSIVEETNLPTFKIGELNRYAYICYGNLNNSCNGSPKIYFKGEDSYIIAMYDGDRGLRSEKSLEWIKFLMSEDSPWKDVFPHMLVTDPETIDKSGFIIKTTAPNKLMYNFLIASRFIRETGTTANILWNLVDKEGWGFREAYVFNSIFGDQSEDTLYIRGGGQHEGLTGRRPVSDIGLNFIYGNYNKNLVTEYQKDSMCTPTQEIWYNPKYPGITFKYDSKVLPRGYLHKADAIKQFQGQCKIGKDIASGVEVNPVVEEPKKLVVRRRKIGA